MPTSPSDSGSSDSADKVVDDDGKGKVSVQFLILLNYSFITIIKIRFIVIILSHCEFFCFIRSR
jgi:hypothetical protein